MHHQRHCVTTHGMVDFEGFPAPCRTLSRTRFVTGPQKHLDWAAASATIYHGHFCRDVSLLLSSFLFPIDRELRGLPQESLCAMPHANDRSKLVFRRLLLSIAAVAIVVIGIGLATRKPVASAPSTPPPITDFVPINWEPAAVQVTPEMQVAAQANGQFAIDLYQQLSDSESGNSFFLSPFSISTVLTMAAEGAVDQTLDQMMSVLHLPKDELEQAHRGQQGLHQAVVPKVPPEITEKIRALRVQLREANQQTETLSDARQFKEAHKSAAIGAKLASEINRIVKLTAGYELQIANALWLEQSYPIEPNFIATVKPHYGAIVFPVDFKTQPDPARRQINDWVSQQTNDRIRDLLGPGTIDNLTRLVLTNTVYFRGDWADPFEAASTQMKPFQQSHDRSADVPMMRQQYSRTASYGAFTATGELFPTPHEVRVDMKDDDPSLYPDEHGQTMLALDYQGGKLQMIMIVPQSSTGLAGLEKAMSYDKLQKWVGQLQRRMVHVSIPKFKLESRYELKAPLESLGMVRPFVNPAETRDGAQFDKLSDPQSDAQPLLISEVIHQTFVDVSEIGTEAAAATAVPTGVSAWADEPPKMRPFTPSFNADKPFLFLIRDRETATILFLGRYVGPRP